MASTSELQAYYDECAPYYDDEEEKNGGEDEKKLMLPEQMNKEEATTKKTYICIERVTQAILQHVAEHEALGSVTERRSLRVLDLGVGTGLASRPLFDQWSAPEIWGVDLSTGMLAMSSRLPFYRLVACNLNAVSVEEQLLARLRDAEEPKVGLFDRPYFDVVLSVGTMEFVQDYDQFFRQLSPLMQTRGLLAATFPLNPSHTYAYMNHVSPDRLKSLATTNGFQVLDMQTYRGWSISATEHVEYIQLLALAHANPDTETKEEKKEL